MYNGRVRGSSWYTISARSTHLGRSTDPRRSKILADPHATQETGLCARHGTGKALCKKGFSKVLLGGKASLKKGKFVMIQYGTWSPYEGSSALLLAFVLFVIAGLFTYLGSKRYNPIQLEQSGKIVGIFLVTIWCLSLVTFLNSIITYMQSLFQQVGNFTAPTSPISPITFVSGLVTFVIIAYLSRSHGLKIALGSAIVGTIAAPMIFELPYDLVVMGKLYPPVSIQITMLFFLPLFLIEISSYSLLTLSPLTKISKYTLFTLAAMFFVFSIWALFGFTYPSSAASFVLNAVSKVLCFVTAITLFLPLRTITA